MVFVLPPQSELVSGGNIYNRELVSALRRQGGTVEEVSESEWARLLADSEVGTFFVDTLSIQKFLAAVGPPGAARPPGQRFVLVVHHLPSLEPGLSDDHPSLTVERAALPRFDGFLATSQYTAALLRARGLTRPCMTVPPALPARARPALEYRPGVRGLLVGNLIPRKGVLPFIAALAAARRRGDQLTVDIVGRSDLDPSYASACVRAAREAGFTDARAGGDEEEGRVVVHFRGPVPYEAMEGFYRDASLLLSPSSMETFGMALQEARAFGLPILATRGGNTAAHVEDGASGHLLDSPAELVDVLLELSRAPDRMRQLFAAAQALRSGGEYTWDVAAQELLRQFGQLDLGERAP
jgi:glycosyltransferase involved in cell wall biosynthesis